MNDRLLRTSLVIAGAMVMLCGIATATRTSADPLQPPSDPEAAAIPVPEGNRVFLIVHAVGTQTYTCTGAGTWSATSVPQADLFADNGHQIGTHFAGPTWQLKDGSSVLGARDKGVTVGTGSIPWLLLHAVTTSAGPDGDRLVPTTYIQRVHTKGGVAPSGACSVGTTVSVPYEADYYFYRSATGN